MSSIRRPLTTAEHSALAATPLPFAVIWSEENFTNFIASAERGATMTYLQYLLEYRNTLAENNPIYNDEQNSAKQTELLSELPKYIETIDPLAEPNLRAAALNIYGLLLIDTKNYNAARNAFTMALQIDNLASLSMASLSHGLALVAASENKLNERHANLVAAVIALEEISFEHTIETHIAAAIYCSMASVLHKKQEFAEALAYHMKAVDLWPENNVICNNAALFFSKQNNKDALLKAESILMKRYDKMISASPTSKSLLFVTPFYRADVNIKLAGFATAVNETSLAAVCLSRAGKYMEIAKQALTDNPNYQQNYRTKGFARLEYLAANMAFISQDYNELAMKKAAAAQLRGQLTEAAGKYEKFMQKFPQPIPFNTAGLFRDRTVATVEDEKRDEKAEVSRLSL